MAIGIFNGYSNSLLQCLWLTITALNRARHRRLIYGGYGVIEEIKTPAVRQGFGVSKIQITATL